MIWKKYKYFILLAFTVIMLIIIDAVREAPVIWTESYSRHDKIPYGNYIMFRELNTIFNQGVSASDENIENTLNTFGTDDQNYLFINTEINPSEQELKRLYAFVADGGNVMLVARHFAPALLDTLNVSVSSHRIAKLSLDTSLKLDLTSQDQKTSFYADGHRRGTIRAFDIKADSSVFITPLGTVADSLINFIHVPHGNGNFYFHSNPTLFSNYHMLVNNGHQYVSEVLSHLPVANTLWDEYYKERKKYIARSPLQQVLSTDGLKQALRLAVLTLIGYMIFASRRRQRTIPVLKPKTNTTLEFTNTIGQLYFNHTDHKEIGTKRVQYFLNFIRRRYHLATDEIKAGSDFGEKLHQASGASIDLIRSLVSHINVIRTVSVISDERIMALDKDLDEFYKQIS